MLPDRAGNVENWEFDKLVTILLRQFKRLLADRDVTLSDSDMQKLGEHVAQRTADPAQLTPINQALREIIIESIGVLGNWDLTFGQSLKTDMNAMNNWQTTAEFLDVANEKINAEVRISAGSSLMVALGDYHYSQLLIEAIEHDLATAGSLDVDAMIAKRTLIFASNIDPKANDWLEQLKVWQNDRQ
ncbi:MAG: hypothetical protein RLP44_06130 [Aggregatilineales bacterium]